MTSPAPQNRPIPGTYCPMGCGETLYLMTSNVIQCTGPECPDDLAAQKILSDPESQDIVLFGPDSFTVLHPLRERLGDLFACQVYQACGALDGPPGGRTGKFRARLDAQGSLDLEPA